MPRTARDEDPFEKLFDSYEEEEEDEDSDEPEPKGPKKKAKGRRAAKHTNDVDGLAERGGLTVDADELGEDEEPPDDDGVGDALEDESEAEEIEIPYAEDDEITDDVDL